MAGIRAPASEVEGILKRVAPRDNGGRDRRVAILLRLKPGERFVVAAEHRCGLPNNCNEAIDWHRAAMLVGLKIRTRHDDVGRIVVWLSEDVP